ncbi:helix-turn-helix domain-containing protein [Thermoactinomyces sp. DSM 45892]|uniref:helix-turn-helix domain-containing protein n=1 Tax=Thermoactinomyces sp. DSM 45892 TaxID=1882753 RepID=UPI0008965671|nr:helix-turn-helix domain-containing protein [Thermoactinomyces sp. DSM 45892]SDY17602.1 Helix-turn-helix domain-containing protein [Thermoactinomyces sp. DSM 45892]
MDFSNVGDNIKQLRKTFGLSQKELAEGICTQAQISKIENGSIYPLSTTLYLISRKLGVDVNYFFDICETPRLDYAQEVILLIQEYKRKRDYEKIYRIVKAEKTNPVFQTLRNKQFLVWHEGICLYYLKKNSEECLRLLKQSLDMTLSAIVSLREIEILNSIAIIHCEEKNFVGANKYFEKAIKHYEVLPYKNDASIIIRIYYNYAKSLSITSEYEKSIDYCNRGIRLCRSNETLYSLGELMYHLGYNWLNLGHQVKAIQYMKESIQIFELQQNQPFIDYVVAEIANISDDQNLEKG